MYNASNTSRDKIESSIPKWIVYSLLFISTLLVVSIVKAYLLLLISGIGMLFIWTQLTKEKAEIQIKDYYEKENQLNLFHNKNMKYKNCKNKNITRTFNGFQKKIYLKTLAHSKKNAA